MRPWEEQNYPIRSLLNNNTEIRNRLFLLMNQNNVVCESNYLRSITKNMDLYYAQKAMNQYKGFINDIVGKELKKCEIEVIANLKIKK